LDLGLVGRVRAARQVVAVQAQRRLDLAEAVVAERLVVGQDRRWHQRVRRLELGDRVAVGAGLEPRFPGREGLLWLPSAGLLLGVGDRRAQHQSEDNPDPPPHGCSCYLDGGASPSSSRGFKSGLDVEERWMLSRRASSGFDPSTTKLSTL